MLASHIAANTAPSPINLVLDKQGQRAFWFQWEKIA
jgi:hypothetical protein